MLMTINVHDGQSHSIKFHFENSSYQGQHAKWNKKQQQYKYVELKTCSTYCYFHREDYTNISIHSHLYIIFQTNMLNTKNILSEEYEKKKKTLQND